MYVVSDHSMLFVYYILLKWLIKQTFHPCYKKKKMITKNIIHFLVCSKKTKCYSNCASTSSHLLLSQHIFSRSTDSLISTFVVSVQRWLLHSLWPTTPHNTHINNNKTNSSCLLQITKSLGMDIPILMEIPILIVNLDHGRLFVESVLGNFNRDQLGMLIMKNAIDLLVDQHELQIVSMTIDPSQLELILDDSCLWLTQWHPIRQNDSPKQFASQRKFLACIKLICPKIGI